MNQNVAKYFNKLLKIPQGFYNFTNVVKFYEIWTHCDDRKKSLYAISGLLFFILIFPIQFY